MITVFIAFLLTFPILRPNLTAAQPNRTQPVVCEYQEKRKSIPINPKTHMPYTPDERNQEPFDGGSISKDEIRQCLQAKMPVKNHHILFEDYRDAWQSLATETGDYAIQLLIEGGVLHSPYNTEANTGGIRLWKFRDPNVSKAFRVKQKDILIALIRSQINWNKVLIDSAVIPFREDNQNIFDIIIIFNAEAYFSGSTFSAEAYFSDSTFNAEAYFSDSTFNAEAGFFDSTFSAEAYFSGSTFNAEAYFRRSTFSAEAYFSDSTFSAEAYFRRSTFNAEAYFSGTRFKNNADFRRL